MSSDTIRIAPLVTLDGAFESLRIEATASGLALLQRLDDGWRSGTSRFDKPGERLFGAWRDGRLVGVGGLNLDPYAGDHSVGRVRHLYVLASERRSGVGAALVRAIVEQADGRFATVQLRTNNPAAAKLYVGLGFEPVQNATATHAMELTNYTPHRSPDTRP